METNEYATLFRVEETHWWYKALHQLIFDALKDELPAWRDKEIIDLGCGTGAILQRLGNADKHVGIDISTAAVEFCRSRGLQNVRQGDIMQVPFPDESFDAAICSSVLYHEWVANVDAALHEIYRVLRPKGLLIVVVPAFRFLHSAHDRAVMTARRFTKPELRRFLVRNGFTIRRLTYWTTFLFPLAVIARTFGGSKMGRDFESNHDSFSQRFFSMVMAVERKLGRLTTLPFGVALLGVARKAERRVS